MNDYQQMLDVYKDVEGKAEVFKNSDVAHLVVHENKVMGAHLVPGLVVEPEETERGIKARIVVKQGVKIEKQVHLCFGVIPKTGNQEILLDILVEKDARVSILAHCMFPNAVKVRHYMDAKIEVKAGGVYEYFEKHIHGEKGGVTVLPNAKVKLGKKARMKTEFELLKGRVGEIAIDYETVCDDDSRLEMVARINGTENDIIKIREAAHLEGKNSRGFLNTRIAVRDKASAEVYNELIASAPYARGHVDCKEIVQGGGVAKAVPIVQVNHPLAHVTHEAAIGSVDSKQLQTLMARGLCEEDAVETIIQALLS